MTGPLLPPQTPHAPRSLLTPGTRWNQQRNSWEADPHDDAAFLRHAGASGQFPDMDTDVADDDATADRIPFNYLTQMAVETDAPVLVTSLGTLDALERIKTFTAKHNINDQARVKAAIAHYEPQIDFDLLLRE